MFLKEFVFIFCLEPEFFSKCEFCGTEEQASRFKRSKRFCTMACAKRYNRAHRTSVFKTRGKHSKIKISLVLCFVNVQCTKIVKYRVWSSYVWVSLWILLFNVVGIGRGMIMKKGSPINLKKGLKGPGRGGKLPYGESRVSKIRKYWKHIIFCK